MDLSFSALEVKERVRTLLISTEGAIWAPSGLVVTHRVSVDWTSTVVRSVAKGSS